MDEGRKRVLLIAASIIAARGLASWHGVGPATESLIHDAIVKANAIMREIDLMWPTAGRRDSPNFRSSGGIPNTSR